MANYPDPRRLQREIDDYERQLEQPVSPERRRAIQDALNHCKDKLRQSTRPRGAL